jgi:hypothetical protein
LHAALDVVQDLAWATNTMFLKSVDRFDDLVVSVYVTAGHILLKLRYGHSESILGIEEYRNLRTWIMIILPALF